MVIFPTKNSEKMAGIRRYKTGLSPDWIGGRECVDSAEIKFEITFSSFSLRLVAFKFAVKFSGSSIASGNGNASAIEDFWVFISYQGPIRVPRTRTGRS